MDHTLRTYHSAISALIEGSLLAVGVVLMDLGAQANHISNQTRIFNLDPPAHLKGAAQEHYLGYLDRLNRDHKAGHPGETDLDARIASYELAFQMQTAAAEALDLGRETAATRKRSPRRFNLVPSTRYPSSLTTSSTIVHVTRIYSITNYITCN